MLGNCFIKPATETFTKWSLLHFHKIGSTNPSTSHIFSHICKNNDYQPHRQISFLCQILHYFQAAQDYDGDLCKQAAYCNRLTSKQRRLNILQRNDFWQPSSQTVYDTEVSKLTWSPTRTVAEQQTLQLMYFLTAT